jgi:Ulp1 family protease
LNLLKIRDNELAALEDDRRGNGFMDTRLMQHLVAAKELTLDPIQVRKVKGYTPNIDKFNFDLLFIPTNIKNMHWTMSYNGEGTIYTNLVKDWLVREMFLKKNHELKISEWKVMTKEAGVPQQKTNGNECGVFAMMCADFVSDNLPMTYRLDEMKFFRRKIAGDILRGHLNYN